MRTLVAVAALAASVAACEQAVTPAPDPAPAAPVPAGEGEARASGDWREIASSDDASRLGRLDQAWRMGRAEADRDFAGQVEALGPLVDPNAGQAGRLHPPPGSYRCRSIRLGSGSPGGLAFQEQPFLSCTVELTPGGDLILTGIAGARRMRGLLYPDTDRRLVFIGALAGDDEAVDWPAYGEIPGRDRLGVLERIGSARWRLVLPWPKQESKLEILELVR